MVAEVKIPDMDLESEELLLPSNGLNGGIQKIFVRPITFKEEKMLTNKSLAKTGAVHELITKECITGAQAADGSSIEVNFDELYVEDEYSLFVFLRMISYGTEYNAKAPCPHCKVKSAISIDLEKDLDVKYADESTPKQIEVTLPKCGRKVTLQYPRKKHTKDLENALDVIPKIITDIEGVENYMWEEWLERRTGMDSAEIRNAVNKDHFGLQKKVPFVCNNPKCEREGEHQEIALPITPEFFRIQSD